MVEFDVQSGGSAADELHCGRRGEAARNAEDHNAGAKDRVTFPGEDDEAGFAGRGKRRFRRVDGD